MIKKAKMRITYEINDEIRNMLVMVELLDKDPWEHIDGNIWKCRMFIDSALLHEDCLYHHKDAKVTAGYFANRKFNEFIKQGYTLTIKNSKIWT